MRLAVTLACGLSCGVLLSGCAGHRLESGAVTPSSAIVVPLKLEAPPTSGVMDEPTNDDLIAKQGSDSTGLVIVNLPCRVELHIESPEPDVDVQLELIAHMVEPTKVLWRHKARVTNARDVRVPLPLGEFSRLALPTGYYVLQGTALGVGFGSTMLRVQY